MRNGLAESISKWLTESAYNLGMFEERRVIVVGIVGKSSSDCSKADPINQLLGRPVFIQHIPMEGSTASVSNEFPALKVKAFLEHHIYYVNFLKMIKIFPILNFR